MGWELLEQVFTVETLMTPREDLLTWERGPDPSALRAEAKRERFELVPVTEGGRIVGVLHSETTEEESLTDKWLVSRDTGIPDLLSLFVESERPGFLVFHRQEVVGLVTPADLNKLPARVYFYNLIGEVELALAGWIRDHFTGDSDELLLTLSEGRRKEIKERESSLAEGNANVDPIQLLDLSDLVNIVAKREELRAGLRFYSRRQTERALNDIVDLRNRTMHPVRPLLERIPDDLVRLHERVEQACDALHRLRSRSRMKRRRAMKHTSSLAIALKSCGINLEPGGRYERRAIHACVGGQRQGGISTPKTVNSVLIFTGPPGKKYGYSDEWLDDNTFLYTGEGQIGDMEMVRGNRAIRDHLQDGKELHLLEIEGKGYVKYVGEMECVDYEWQRGEDAEGKERKLLRFRLKRID